MHQNRVVSILIPVYNREKIIAETIESALGQSYTNIEIIIVDNASSDGTWNVVDTYAQKDNRIKAFRNETNIGPVRNWQRCIDEASGEYGKILWSDDLITPDFLQKCVPYLENDDVGFVFTSVKLFSEDDAKIYYDFDDTALYPTERFLDAALFNTEKMPLSPGCALFRFTELKSALLLDVPNSIDSDFSMHAIGNDLLIFLLIAREHRYFAFINEPLALFRSHGDSISVASDKSKLHLLYGVAKAYYIEHYGSIQMMRRYNGILKVLTLVYRKNSVNIHTIRDFYLKNENESVDYLFLLKWLINRARQVFKGLLS